MAPEPTTIGRYQVRRALGRGGMGTLYLASDPALGREVALKVLNFDDVELRQRFQQEARAVARLRHRHIVTIYDVGEDAGQPFIAMEYIQGDTLSALVKRREPLSIARKLEIIEELCDGLGYAHTAGIVHRDIKPDNVMVDPEGSLKILDFGIARSSEATGVTRTGVIVGTLNYMSPEQVAGTAVDSRSDIFAVGLVLYELLSYQQAFPGRLESGLLHKIFHNEPPPLNQISRDVPPDVMRIVAKAIEKDPLKRYQDLGAMRRELAIARGAMPRASVARTELIDPISMLPTVVTPVLALSTSPAAPADRRPLYVGAAAAVVCVLGVAGYLVAGRSAAARPAAAGAPVAAPSVALPAADVVTPPPVAVPAPTDPPRVSAQPAAVSERASKLARLRTLAAAQYGRGERQQALASAEEALGVDEGDARVRALVGGWLQEALEESKRARDAADAVGPAATRAASYASGVEAEQGADNARAARPADALQAAWRATDAFHRAVDEGRAAAASSVSAAPPKAEAPATAPPVVPKVEAPKLDAARVEAPQNPPGPAPVDEKAEIGNTLQKYAAAYSALSFDALRTVWPGAPEQLRTGFRGLSSQRKEIRERKNITVTGATAVATCTVSTDVVAAVGRQRSSLIETVTFSLQRTGAGWIITSVSSAN